MALPSNPKRFGVSERKSHVVSVTPLHQMIVKSFNKAIGTHVKKPSARKPKIHDRSFRPRDINNYVQHYRRRGIQPSVDHDFDEFFDDAGSTSLLSRRFDPLPKRRIPQPSDGRIEGLPTSPHSSTPSLRKSSKVAPYQAPASTKYGTGKESVDIGPWIIRSRSYLRKRRESPPKSSGLLPSVIPEESEVVFRSPDEADGDVEKSGDRKYSRVEDVISKRDTLYPVPPKLPKMRMRRKVGLQSLSRAPEIGWKDGENEEAEGEEGEDGEEEEEEMENLPEDDRRKDEVDEKVGRGDGEKGGVMADEEEEDDADGKFVDFVQGVWDNSDRASVGMKLTRQCFGFSTTSPTQKVISRPFFTVWITIIQAIIYFVIIGLYGIAPIGIDWKDQEADVLMTDLTIQHQVYKERPNLWIGPREADLIHLGAKFAPCMRTDKNVEALLEGDRKKQDASGCCVNNDGSGCVQTSKNDCPQYLSTWNHTVCGEDPKYCHDPEYPKPWSHNITQWPICKNSSKPPANSGDYHMTCQVVGRPCCVGVRGECVMATREYCDFRRGYFHEDASLCSQVQCLKEVCGMIRFTDPKKPDQYYRFFTSLCIHPGLLALAITQIFQWIIQYDLERYIGWWSMAVVYVGCGYCGSVLSAIFIPYFVEAGPSGSQFGVLAAMTVEIVRWNAEEKPRAQLVIIVLCLLILFIVGIIVPQVDNWAHLGGYFIGILLAVGFHPFKHFCDCGVPSYCYVITRVMCFLWAATIAAILTVVFYLIDVKQCNGCQYFNCVPFTDTYCMGMGVNITSLSN